MKNLLGFLDKYRDVGLLILRVGIGLMFVAHGLPKVLGGPEKWAKLGAVMGVFGLDFAPAFWGFMAAVSECGGGALLALGLFARPACFFLLCVMTVATSMHLNKGDPFQVYSHPIEAGIVFFSLLIIGPGKYSLDRLRSPFASGSG